MCLEVSWCGPGLAGWPRFFCFRVLFFSWDQWANLRLLSWQWPRNKGANPRASSPFWASGYVMRFKFYLMKSKGCSQGKKEGHTLFPVGGIMRSHGKWYWYGGCYKGLLPLSYHKWYKMGMEGKKGEYMRCVFFFFYSKNMVHESLL